MAGDGSLKRDGSMGAALVLLNDRVAVHGVVVFQVWPGSVDTP